MEKKCENCGKLESQHYYYYKSCFSIEQIKWRFKSKEITTLTGEKE